MIESALLLLAHAGTLFEPPPELPLSQWSDEFRVLSREDSAAPGRWSTDSRPYQRAILDALTDPRVTYVTVMGGAQWGKTQILLNWLGRSIHLDPGPLMVVGPTVDAVKRWSKTRLAPMLRDTPVLAALASEEKARDSSNTIFEKTFPGGTLVMVGSNAPAGLASQPIRDLGLDELDRFGEAAQDEGDPAELAEARTLDFEGRRKIYANSTPTLAGASRIATRYELSCQFEYCVPCPGCGHRQPLVWDRVRWTPGKPMTARYHCTACDLGWNQTALRQAIKRAGEFLDKGWIAKRPEITDHFGFHVPGLLSRNMETMAKKLEDVRTKSPEALQTWWNTSLGLPFDPRDLEELQADGLMTRREDYGAVVPHGVGMLSAGVDVQADRLEWMVWGHGAAGEMWLIERGVIPGNPVFENTWDPLAAVLTSTFTHAAGVEMPISGTCVDTGYATKEAQAFCRRMRGWKVFPIKGAKAVQVRPVMKTSPKARQWMVDGTSLKDIFLARLRVPDSGPGRVHFPKAPWKAEKEVFEQLLSEHVVIRRSNRVDRRVYEKIQAHARNEALDCTVYAMAAFELLSPRDMAQRLAELKRAGSKKASASAEPVAQEPPPPAPSKPAPRRVVLPTHRQGGGGMGW